MISNNASQIIKDSLQCPQRKTLDYDVYMYIQGNHLVYSIHIYCNIYVYRYMLYTHKETTCLYIYTYTHTHKEDTPVLHTHTHAQSVRIFVFLVLKRAIVIPERYRR